MGLLFSSIWNRFNTMESRMLMVGLDAAGKVKCILSAHPYRVPIRDLYQTTSHSTLLFIDYYPVQAEAGRHGHHDSYHRYGYISSTDDVKFSNKSLHALVRIQRGDTGVQECQIHCLGHRRAGKLTIALRSCRGYNTQKFDTMSFLCTLGQDQTAVETLLREQPRVDLRCRLQRQRPHQRM
jgi:hypothetical protein